MVIISDNINFNTIDLTADIEDNLSYLKSMNKHASSYIIDLEDQCASIIESYRNIGTQEKIDTLEDDITYSSNENINQNIENIKLKVLASASVVGASDAINRYYSNQLNSLRYIKTTSDKTSAAELLSLENNTQYLASKLAISLDAYENDIINGMNISAAFKETEKLISSQMNLNSMSMSSEMLENIDYWNEELEFYRESFLLNDLGNFDSKYALDKIYDEQIEKYSDGNMLNDIVPSNYSSTMSSIFNEIDTGSNIDSSLKSIVSQLPPNYASMNPLALTTEYSAVMNDLMSQMYKLQSMGQLSTNLINQISNLPNNMSDVLSVVSGNLPLSVQSNLYSLVRELNILSPSELNSLINISNISSSLNSLPNLDSLMNMISSGNLASLGNYTRQLSNITSQLSSLTNMQLPGNLNSILNGMPTNFSGILNGMGGIPGLSTIKNLTSNITGSITNITSSVTGIINNVSNLASNALSSLGSLASLGSFGSIFGGGDTGSPGPVVPPLLY